MGETGEREFGGKPTCSSLCLSLCSRTSLLRVWLATFFPLWFQLSISGGMFSGRGWTVPPSEVLESVCRNFTESLWMVADIRETVTHRVGWRAEGDVLGETFTVTSRPAFYPRLFNGKRWFEESLTCWAFKHELTQLYCFFFPTLWTASFGHFRELCCNHDLLKVQHLFNPSACGSNLNWKPCLRPGRGSVLRSAEVWLWFTRCWCALLRSVDARINAAVPDHMWTARVWV